jgi:hypothetical protein
LTDNEQAAQNRQVTRGPSLTEERSEQVKKPWSEQNTAAKYLRKLMVDHFKMNVDDVDKLWANGEEPPLCESDFIVYG